MSTVSTTPEPIDADVGGSRSRLRAVAVAVGLLVGALLVSTALAVAVLVPLLATGATILTPEVIVASAVATQVGFLLVAGVYAWRTGLTIPVRVPTTRRELVWIGGGTVLALVLASGGLAALQFLGVTEGLTSAIGDVAAFDPTVLLVLAVLSVLLVAPAEELLFRGVIQGRLRRAFGPAAAIVGATVLFAAIHASNYPGSPVVAIVAVLGVLAVAATVFGAAYERTGNLAVPIAIHALYNTVLFGSSYLVIVG
jgi:membrane protease YdiL (CAAX protease family)